MKSRNLNFLEPCELLQGCNGTALTLQFIVCGQTEQESGNSVASKVLADVVKKNKSNNNKASRSKEENVTVGKER
jgi:hypothetical protein